MRHFLERRADYPGLVCETCWELHCTEGEPYPCPQCPEQCLTDPDRLALEVWRLVDTRFAVQGAGGPFVLEAIRQNLPDLSAGEWLGLVDRLTMIHEFQAAHAPREPETPPAER